MASSLSPVCFPFVQASYADVATACSARLSLCGRGTGPPQADRQYGHGKESAVDAADMFPADEQASEVPEPREAALDGLLTTHTFCLTRTAMLPLSWSRQPLRLRTVSLHSRGS